MYRHDTDRIGLTPCLCPVLRLIVCTLIEGPTRHQKKSSQSHTTPPSAPSPARHDEQGLLVNYSDNERAETPSLHSNTGRERRGGKRKSKTGANVTRQRTALFGFDLFGRPPPFQLPDDDDVPLFHRHRSGNSSTPTTTLTT